MSIVSAVSRTAFFVLMTVAVVPFGWLALTWWLPRAIARGADPAAVESLLRIWRPLFAAMFVLGVLVVAASAAGWI